MSSVEFKNKWWAVNNNIYSTPSLHPLLTGGDVGFGETAVPTSDHALEFDEVLVRHRKDYIAMS